MTETTPTTIAIVGLGYVGLPVAVAFAGAGYEVIGFDTNEGRLAELKSGNDRTGSVEANDLNQATLILTDDPSALTKAGLIIVAVPTPIDQAKRPDLGPFRSAARTVGTHMSEGCTVVFESTVFPGATEDVAVPILEECSGLQLGKGFQVGYSPERINPGDTARGFADIIKIVSGSSPETTDLLARTYGSVVTAGIHVAPSIKVAEAAKVIENTQRDLNIALMNELSVLFHTIGIDTRDVLAGASTKWNFLPFQPGLVGGHCIGVDPYYLTHKAQELGLTPQIISSGRGTNEAMPAFVAGRIIQGCVRLGRQMPPRISVLGITYKADVPDTRNSKVVDLITELRKFGAVVIVTDPIADPKEVADEYGLTLASLDEAINADAVVLAVAHSAYINENAWDTILRCTGIGKCLVADLPAALDRAKKPNSVELWRL